MQSEASTQQPIDETARRRFEAAWREGHAPILEDYLPPPADACYLPTLEEFVHIDMEMGWKAHQKHPATSLPRVEDYLARCPLLNQPAIVLRLLRQEYRMRQKYGDRPSTAEYRTRFPTLVGTGAEIETLVTQPASGSRAEPVPRIPGYEVLEPLGRGGMGVVYKARHVALNRIVALKMIRGDCEENEVARFQIEAESSARLHHPNIVQVYEVGTAEGQPYLSLEYVPGGTLGNLIGDSPQAPRLSAATIERLARAIHAAHLAGILHRDLKPGNILLAPAADTESGDSIEPLPWVPKIADFGLAKRIQEDQGQTQTGAILGTPGYMAPEQAAARKDIDRRADVYALGAVLYHMLTGRPPFKSRNTWDMLSEVVHKEPEPPSRLQPKLPRDLETICMKCLRKEPAARYAGAEELADDLRRFLRGETVQARPVGFVERAWRWCRREKKLAVLVSIIFVVIALGGSVAATLWVRMEREAAARLETDLREIDSELGFIDREEFTLSPQMDDTRRLFLEKLAKKCQELTEQKHRSPRLQQKKAGVYLRLGTIYELLGRYTEAENGYHQAIALQADTASDPMLPDRGTLAKCYHQYAKLLQTLGRLDEAENQFGRVIELLDGSGEEDLRLARAAALHDFGKLQVMTGRLDEGEKNYRRSLELQRQLVAEQPAVSKNQLLLAAIETSLANHLVDLSRFEESAMLFDAAVGRQEKLIAGAPSVPIYRGGLARTLTGRGRRFEFLGLKKETTDDVVRVHDIFKKLAGDYPHRPDYRLEFASAQHRIARGMNDGVLANVTGIMGVGLEQSYRDTIAQQERLVAEFPLVVDYNQQLAITLNTCATLLNDQSVGTKGEAGTRMLEEAAGMHRRSEAIWTRLAADHPTVVAYQNGLTTSDQRFGIVLERQKRFEEAASHYRHSIGVQEQLAAKYPGIARHDYLLSALHNNLGVIADRRHDFPEAERLFRVAITWVLSAQRLNPANPTYSSTLSRSTANLAEMLLNQGKYQEAAPLVRDVPHLHPRRYWDFSPTFAAMRTCIEQAENDPSLLFVQRLALISLYGDWMIDAVKCLILAGEQMNGMIGVRGTLETDRGLDRVRSRPDFQALYRDVCAKCKPVKP